MPYKRFAALAVFMISTALYFACNPDSSAKSDKPAESTQSSGQPGAINWRKGWSAAKSEAASSGKLVMIDFYTTWCAPCKMLEKKAFPDARVVKAASQLVAIRQDAEREGKSLAKEYGIRAYPTLLFVDGGGKVKGRIEGYYDPEELAPQIQKMVDNHK